MGLRPVYGVLCLSVHLPSPRRRYQGIDLALEGYSVSCSVFCRHPAHGRTCPSSTKRVPGLGMTLGPATRAFACCFLGLSRRASQVFISGLMLDAAVRAFATPATHCN